MLPWNPSQKRTSGTWSEDKDKCKNLQGSEENCSKQEEVGRKQLSENELKAKFEFSARPFANLGECVA